MTSARAGRLATLILVTGALTACAARTAPAPTGPAAPPAAAGRAETAPRTPAALAATAALHPIFSAADLSHAHIAVLVRSLTTGDTLYALNPQHLLVPASSQKVLTTAAAARRLGWDFQLTTTIRALGRVDARGVLDGDLVITGSGDPTISPRFPERWAVIDGWADRIATRGITRITGRVIGDDGAAKPAWGSGWSWDDLTEDYGSPVGALQINENELHLTVTPAAEPGLTARIAALPDQHAMTIVNRVATGEAGSATRVSVERAPGTEVLTLSGSIARDARPRLVRTSLANPTRTFAAAVRAALVRRGIFVDGSAVDIDDLPAPLDLSQAETWITDQSLPLRTMIDPVLRHSMNGYAESLLWALSPPGAPASEAAGLTVLRQTLTEMGVDPAGYRAFDGSGLSRYDMLSPLALVQTLTAVWQDPVLREPYMAALPHPGRPGSFERRFVGTPAAGRVWAKTGSMFNIRTMSGFITTDAGEPLVFSMMANQYTTPTARIDEMMNAAVIWLASPRTTR